MAEFTILVDVARCNGCYSCMLACKDEHCGHEYEGYTVAQPMTGQFWMKMTEKEMGSYPKVRLSYTPIACMHCEDAQCIKAAENKAVYRREDGIVIIDPEKAKGQKQLINACPYRVIYWNEELETPQKCTMCAHLLDKGWQKPRCVEMCPTDALVFGDLSDPQSEVSALLKSGEYESLRPDFQLKERIRYRNVPTKFITGTVVYGDLDECAKDVTVTIKNGKTVQSITTDGFGDFWFERLGSNIKYTVTFETDAYQTKTLAVKTANDVNLGDVILNK